MGFYAFIIAYFLGGLTLLPICLCLILVHAYLAFPERQPEVDHATKIVNSIGDLNDDGQTLKSGAAALPEKFKRGYEPDAAAGYFTVTRDFIPGGIRAKPQERATTTAYTASPSVYQTMYKSIFERKQASTLEASWTPSNFFIALRSGCLMLYDNEEQLEVRHVISLGHHDVGFHSGEGEIPEGELFIKRTALCLTRKSNTLSNTPISKPFYLFSENCSEKEDFYFAMLRNQENTPDDAKSAPRPQEFVVKDIITLVQRLHSSEELLQTRWLNAMIGRLFLAMYKTPEIESFLRQKITKKISRVKKPAFLSGVTLGKLDMGFAAPYVTNPRLKDLTVDGDCCVEADLNYSGNFMLEVATTARIELGTRLKAREVNLVLAVVIKKVEGRVLVRFKPPPSNRIWISFETAPDMEMDIEPIVSSRQITYSFILRAIESRIREVIAETIVQPNWDDIPFLDTMYQTFRGGIWSRDPLKSDLSSASRTRNNSDDHNGIEGDDSITEPNLRSSGSSAARDERSISMPALVESPPRKPVSRKISISSQTPADGLDHAFSSGMQRRTEPPRAMRSQSFATTADPIVSTENTNVDGIREDVTSRSRAKSKQQIDATTSMKAISSRSQPTSPSGTPLTSPAITPVDVKTHSHSGSISSISSKDDSMLETAASQTTVTSLSEETAPMPATPTSDRSSTLYSGFGHQPSNQRTPSPGAQNARSEKRQSLVALGAATVAAKKWGWGVIGRGQDHSGSRNGNSNDGKGPERLGTPDQPIGRGQPLPPPGQPLPPPQEKRGSWTKSMGVPKRKTLPPPTLPRRSKDEQPKDGSRPRAVPPPPLPARKLSEAPATAVIDDDGVVVIEAPPDSEAVSPIEQTSEELSTSSNSEHIEAPNEPSSDVERGVHQGEGNDEVPFPRPTSKHAFEVYEDGENKLPSWQSAQEESERSKNIWIDDHEHS